MIDTGHKQLIVMHIERKSGFAVLSHVTRKTANLFCKAIITSLAHLEQRIRTVTCENGKEFADHTVVDEALKSTAYFADPFVNWKSNQMKTLKSYCASTFLKATLIYRDCG